MTRTHAPRTASSGRCSRLRRSCTLRRRQPPRHRHAGAVRNVLGRTSRRRSAAAPAAVVPEILGFDPRCSSSTKTTSSARSPTRRSATGPASSTSPATGGCRGANVAMVGKRRIPLPPVLTDRLAADRCACCGSSNSRRRRSRCCATGAASTTARYKEVGVRYRYSTAGAGAAFTGACVSGNGRREAPRSTGTNAKSRNSFGTRPAVSPRPTMPLRVGTTRPGRRPDPRRPRAAQRAERGDGRRDHRAIEELRGRPRVGAVVVTGAPPAFCSGADSASLEPEEVAATQVRSIYDGFLRSGVAAADGRRGERARGRRGPQPRPRAATCGSRRTAARFDPRFLRIGLHPGGGHTWMLERAVGPQTAAAMVLFGRPSPATRAGDRARMAMRPRDELLAASVALAARAAEAPPEQLAG